MNVHFETDFIEKIKYAIPIVDLASDYFTLQKMSNNMYRSNCKHRGGDKTPSLTFYAKTNTFYCYSCHAGRRDSETSGSDIICFVKWMENLSWQDAVIYIAKLAGIELPKKNLTKEDKEKIQMYNNLLSENRTYWNNLEKATDVKEYFYNRNLSNDDINKFRLGAKWCREVNDFRPIYSIMDEQGRTVAFSTRLGLSEIKYKNSATSLIYKKKETLYGLSLIKKDIREKGFIVIVEGQNDVIQLQKYNVPAVAPMGTAITNEHIRIIKRYTNTVILFLDGDKAGEDNTIISGIKLKENGLNVYAITIDGFDPDDISRKMKENTMEYIDIHKEPILNYIINLKLNKAEKEISIIKMNVIQELNTIMNTIEDSLDKEYFYSKAKNRLLTGSDEVDIQQSSSVLGHAY